MNSNFRLVINPFAELDLHASFEFYELQRDGLGKDFIKEIDSTLKRIQSNPRQFSQHKRNIRKALVEKFPFTVFFYLTGDLINIFAIFHFSRDPKRLVKRTRR